MHVNVCLAVTCHLYCWQKWPGYRLLWVTGDEGYRNESVQKVDPREEKSPATPKTQDLLIMSLAVPPVFRKRDTKTASSHKFGKFTAPWLSWSISQRRKDHKTPAGKWWLVSLWSMLLPTVHCSHCLNSVITVNRSGLFLLCLYSYRH